MEHDKGICGAYMHYQGNEGCFHGAYKWYHHTRRMWLDGRVLNGLTTQADFVFGQNEFTPRLSFSVFKQNEYTPRLSFSNINTLTNWLLNQNQRTPDFGNTCWQINLSCCAMRVVNIWKAVICSKILKLVGHFESHHPAPKVIWNPWLQFDSSISTVPADGLAP